MRPKRLPVEFARNQDKERAVAKSCLIPMRPKNRTNAPSRMPIPEIEIGSAANMMMSGTNIRQARNGMYIPNPRARMYTAKKPEKWTKPEISKAFKIIPF
jgi:hypothetical protein